MKKVIFSLAIVTVLICIAYMPSVSSLEQTKSDDASEKSGTIYGPYLLPYMLGDVQLTEEATYSFKFCIGDFCIYRNLKLTGYVDMIGPSPGWGPFQIGNTRFDTESYAGNATLTIGLWIGYKIFEEIGEMTVFQGRIGTTGFNVQLETLD